MNDFRNPEHATPQALLPAGLRDTLPPAAEAEAEAVASLIAGFAAYGYERVKPPLIEFEESLVKGGGAATAAQTFRLMDPVSQRMMGLRPDMTVQVARIATTRLANAARPLRLCYAGQVLRIKGSQLRPERQFTQVGAELIGSDQPGADAEVIAMAAEALGLVGISGLSVDLGMPTLAPAVCDHLGLSAADKDLLRTALDRKDGAAVAALGGEAARLFGALLRAAGPLDQAVAMVAGLGLPERAAAQWTALTAVAEGVRAAAPDLTITVDPVENRGYEYHNGVTFTFFAVEARGELGRGGRYPAGTTGEAATGVTLFMDTILRAAPRPARRQRLYLPADTPLGTAARLRAEGWTTVRELKLDRHEDGRRARALGCTHGLVDGAIIEIE